MKRSNVNRIAAGILAAGLTLGLTACSGAAIASQDTADSDAATAESAATGDTAAADEYAYLADFDYSSIFDENGYIAGVTAGDCLSFADDMTLTLSDEANTVTDEDVSDYITNSILPNFTTTQQVTDRAAQDGDSVNIDYVGSVDGVEFDGGSATGYDLTLGSGSFIDDFEDQIVGHTPGETFNVEVTFPDDYSSEDLAGKDAVFVTTLNYINETVTPEVTDEWVAENLGDSLGVSDVAGLDSYVYNQILYSQQANELYGALYDAASLTGGMPEALKTFYTDGYLYNYYQYAQSYGMPLSDFLTAVGYDSVDAYLDAAADSINSAAMQTLIMQAMAEKYGIVCDDAALAANAEDYFGTTDLSSYTDVYGENYLKMNVLNNLVMDKLIEVSNA